jgi:hypothetical protein
MAREVLRRHAVASAVVMAALSLALWGGANVDDGPDVGGPSTAIGSGPAELDHALVRIKTDSVGNWWALRRSSKTVAVGLAVLVSLVAAGLRQGAHVRPQLIAVTPLLARRYSLVVRGPPSIQFS